ncbi:unnamed protein product [Prorocentrum cordatum]|uniref:Uncharacterized protein n=1 Tax=Prorocentrum cordatum TaxID=2364126 RepID=A0ABN9U6P1_9DINO|nr:unnamed protein product [Polarella glacialis]
MDTESPKIRQFFRLLDMARAGPGVQIPRPIDLAPLSTATHVVPIICLCPELVRVASSSKHLVPAGQQENVLQQTPSRKGQHPMPVLLNALLQQVELPSQAEAAAAEEQRPQVFLQRESMYSGSDMHRPLSARAAQSLDSSPHFARCEAAESDSHLPQSWTLAASASAHAGATTRASARRTIGGYIHKMGIRRAE